MGKFLQKCFLLVFFFTCLQVGRAEEYQDFLPLIKLYQTAYNNSDFSLLDSVTFSSKEYSDLITKIDKEHPDCLTEFDKTFDVNLFRRAFIKSHLYVIKTDSIVLSKISDFSTCSDLDIKRIECFVLFKKENKSIPINLIIINVSGNKHKILLDIVNENYFTNEKF